MSESPSPASILTDTDRLRARLDAGIAAIESLRGQLDAITALGRTIVDTLAAGGTLYTAGNGGSAAQALHLAEELIGRYRGDRPAQRAICLNADATAMTCIANDYGFQSVFSRPCEALLREDDVLVVLSTSGNSDNVINALRVARDRGTTTLGLLGGGGGQCLSLCDQSVIVDAGDSAHVQEAHQVVIHLICEMVEEATNRPGD